MPNRVMELFAGPGGLSEALAELGFEHIGIENDPTVCATRATAGHATIQADVAQLITCYRGWTELDGLVGSPPCQAFSQAEKGAGRAALPKIAAAVKRVAAGRPIPDLNLPDPRAKLVLQPVRWVRDLRPRWIVLEQVPAVLSLWRVYADQFAAWGYRGWCGILNAADYGVAQTRQRAFLLASLDRHPYRPAPTHTRRPGVLSLFGGDLLPWVSMAEALGWDADGPAVVRTCQATELGRGHRARYERSTLQPSPTLVTNWDRWRLRSNQKPDRGARDYQTRPATQPAQTITGNADLYRWVGPDDEGRLLTTEEALVLQSFRADYPVQGNKEQRAAQIGNAVPPLLALHVIAEAAGIGS